MADPKPIGAPDVIGRQSLADALDALFLSAHSQRLQFARDLVGLILTLTNAESVVAFKPGSPMEVLAEAGTPRDLDGDRKAARKSEDRASVLHAAPTRLAASLEDQAGRTLLISVAMMPGNQIAVSLAHERLEMIRTICRLRGQSAHLSLPQGLFNAIAEVASGDWSKAQELADLIARATGEPAIMLGQLQGGCVREVHISGQAVVADRASARISAVEEMERAVRMPGANRCALVVGSAATQAVITTQERPLPEPIAQALTEVFNAHSRHGAYKPRLRKAAKVIGCIMAVMALGLVPVSDGVNLPASLVAQNHRTVTAPFDGRVAEIAVKDGQSVRAGETVLLRMDTTEIEADIALAVADLSAAITRRDAARGTRDAAALREAEIETTQATLRHDALKAQLGRADVLAPIDGIVQAEALEQRASSYVSLGTTVLEIVDPDTLEVEIMVSPRARGRLNAGAIGRFQPDAIPTTKIGFDLSTISVAPVSARKDVNFAARSKPLHGLDTSRLRPGMEGVARFEHDDLPLAVLIWRRIRDWALLTLWI